MTTLTNMSSHIQDEERRSTANDVAAINRYIQDAIRHYSAYRFWFNEAQGASFNTADGTEYYAIPAPLRTVDSVLAIITTLPATLTERTNEWIEEHYVPTGVYKGQPSDWALFENKIRLYPIPDAVYAVKTQGYGIALPISTSDDATPWANEAYSLIKSRARALFARDWRSDPEGYAIHTAAEREALASIMSESNRRVTSGHIRGWGVC